MNKRGINNSQMTPEKHHGKNRDKHAYANRHPKRPTKAGACGAFTVIARTGGRQELGNEKDIKAEDADARNRLRLDLPVMPAIKFSILVPSMPRCAA